VLYLGLAIVAVLVIGFWLFALRRLPREDQWNETSGKGHGSGGPPPV
jgi:hypothetical protein